MLATVNDFPLLDGVGSDSRGSVMVMVFFSLLILTVGSDMLFPFKKRGLVCASYVGRDSLMCIMIDGSLVVNLALIVLDYEPQLSATAPPAMSI